MGGKIETLDPTRSLERLTLIRKRDEEGKLINMRSAESLLANLPVGLGS